MSKESGKEFWFCDVADMEFLFFFKSKNKHNPYRNPTFRFCLTISTQTVSAPGARGKTSLYGVPCVQHTLESILSAL